MKMRIAAPALAVGALFAVLTGMAASAAWRSSVPATIVTARSRSSAASEA